MMISSEWEMSCSGGAMTGCGPSLNPGGGAQPGTVSPHITVVAAKTVNTKVKPTIFPDVIRLLRYYDHRNIRSPYYSRQVFTGVHQEQDSMLKRAPRMKKKIASK